eukprot:gene219-biopygen7292
MFPICQCVLISGFPMFPDFPEHSDISDSSEQSDFSDFPDLPISRLVGLLGLVGLGAAVPGGFGYISPGTPHTPASRLPTTRA